MIEILTKIFENFNRKKNARQNFKKLKITSNVFFLHIFYIIFRRLNIFATIFEIILMNELKDRFLSRMLRVIIDNFF